VVLLQHKPVGRRRQRKTGRNSDATRRELADELPQRRVLAPHLGDGLTTHSCQRHHQISHGHSSRGFTVTSSAPGDGELVQMSTTA